mgnify:CR=1 FL=1
MYELIVMGFIKTSALTFIAIVACLVLLSIPDSYRDEAWPADTPTANEDSPTIDQQPTPYRFEREQTGILESNAAPPIEQAPPLPANWPEATQPTDWPFVLYPELAQITELENLPADMALGELLPMLYHDVPAIRLAAIQSLGDMTISAALPALSAALDDPDPKLRIAALEALASHDGASAVYSIEPYLLDQERDVRIAAIEALADLESKTAVHALAKLLTDQDSVIRRHSVYALGEIGGEYAMMYLLQARYDPDGDIRTNAEEILMELEY